MTSTVAIGKAFENHSMKFLNHHLNMCVRRVGGAGDEGIDLRGWWFVPAGARRAAPVAPPAQYGGVRAGIMKGEVRDTMARKDVSLGWGLASRDQYGMDGWKSPSTPEELGSLDDEGGWRRIRVLAQCKAEGKQLGTRALRELEGVMAHFHGRDMELGPHQYDLTGRRLDREPPATVAVLLSRSGFSANATIRAWRSPSPMILVHLPGGSPLAPNVRDDGVGEEGTGMKVIGCWWNPALSGLKGLLGGTMEMRREILKERAGDAESSGPRDQWRVWYQGKRMGRIGPSIGEALAGSKGRNQD